MNVRIIRNCYAISKKVIENVSILLLTNLSTLGNNKQGETPDMLTKKQVLAGFGNPLLDITVKIEDDKLLKKYNLNRDDQKEISVKEMNSLLNDIAQ